MAADYAIGDIQGCFKPLMQLLDKIAFNDREDRLWFTGDLVNRGPQSLEVLRFIKSLSIKPRISLGNHDLHLLATLYREQSPSNPDDTLHAILTASDRDALGEWLRQQPLLYHDEPLNAVLCHAGICPLWTLEEAKNHAGEVESVLRGEHFRDYLNALYGNEPDLWSDDLSGMERLRLITNYFTRMRYCSSEGRLMLQCKDLANPALEEQVFPWFLVPARRVIREDILFGHWAALRGFSPVKNIHALDTGCFWGGELTALRLQDKKRFSVKGMST